MPELNILKQPDDLVCEPSLVDDPQRREIRRDQPARSIERGDADSACRERFDYFQRAAPDLLVGINADRTASQVRLNVLDEVEHLDAWLLKTYVPCGDYPCIRAAEDP